MKTPEYKIVSPDYWEQDAFLLVNGKKHYFQFYKEPSLEEALRYLFSEGLIQIKE